MNNLSLVTMILYDKFLILPGSQYFTPFRLMTGSYNKKTRLLLHTRQQSVRFQCFSVVLCGDQIHTGTGRKES